MMKRLGAVRLPRCGKRGSEMVEASFVVPVIILVVVLFLRIFAFCLEILSAQVKAHALAVSAADSFDKPYISTYKDSTCVRLSPGGILSEQLTKEISVRAYLINEDALVRAGEILNDSE